jgi:segregation and condensation protein A
MAPVADLAPELALASAVGPAPLVVEFAGFCGTLTELVMALRQERVAASQVPLLLLCQQVLLRFEQWRASLLDEASAALPLLASVIELKLRLLLPPLPSTEDSIDHEGQLDPDAVAAGVERLAELDGLVGFLRLRRLAREQVVTPPAQAVTLQRQPRPTGRGLAELVAAAKRRVRTLSLQDVALERLTLVTALTTLRQWAARLRSFLFGELPFESWGERTVFFAALLEGIKNGDVVAEQPEIYGEIQVTQRTATVKDTVKNTADSVGSSEITR